MPFNTLQNTFAMISGASSGIGRGFVDAFGEVEPLHAEDIAAAVPYIVTSPRRVAVNEIVIRPTDQP